MYVLHISWQEKMPPCATYVLRAVLLCWLCVSFSSAQCPAHAAVNAAGTGCRCDDGYAVNSAGTGCEVFVCPYQNDGECDVSKP